MGHNSHRIYSTERAFSCSDDPGHPPCPARILTKNQRPGPARISQKLLRPGPARLGFFDRRPGPARIFKSVPWPGPARTALHSMRPGPWSGIRPGPCPPLVDAAGRGAFGRRSGRARRGMCWGGGVSGVGARVVVVQGLAVVVSLGCIFWTDGMPRSENFLSGAVGWFHVFV